MVKEHISLVSLAAAIYMQENGTAIFIVLPVFPIKFIDFGTTLLKACHLVQGNGGPHTSFTLAVRKITVITNTVFSILDNDMDFGTFLHQITGETQSDVIGVFVFMQLYSADLADGSRVGTSVPADYIKTGTPQTVRSNLYIGKPFSEQRLIDGPFLLPADLEAELFRNGGSTYFTPSRNSSFPLRRFSFSFKNSL